MRHLLSTMVCVAATALAACGGGGTAPSPVPTSPAGANGLALNPASMKLGGFSPTSCPSPAPSGTWCLTGYNAFPVDSVDQAAAVRFDPVGGGGAYAVAVADPTVAAASQPVAGADGREVFGVTPLKVGSTSIRVTAPNGATALLPVSVTSLTVVLDFSRVPATTSYWPVLGVGSAEGGLLFGGVSLAHGANGPIFPGGSIVTVSNAPAYTASGTVDVNDLKKTLYTFAPVSSISVSNSFYDSKTNVTPVTIVDGQANTVTVVVSPPGP